MKREIKFRAWDEKQSEMSHNISVLSPEMTLRRYTGNEIYIHPKSPDYVLMQFTGLLDKNGKEIYEGDILRINGGADDYFALVDFENGCFVAIRSDKVEGSSNPELKYYLFDMSEVIGNIYENPELFRSYLKAA